MDDVALFWLKKALNQLPSELELEGELTLIDPETGEHVGTATIAPGWGSWQVHSIVSA